VFADLRRRVQEVRLPAEARERLWAALRRAADEEQEHGAAGAPHA
jgi:hypothetical protein